MDRRTGRLGTVLVPAAASSTGKPRALALRVASLPSVRLLRGASAPTRVAQGPSRFLSSPASQNTLCQHWNTTLRECRQLHHLVIARCCLPSTAIATRKRPARIRRLPEKNLSKSRAVQCCTAVENKGSARGSRLKETAPSRHSAEAIRRWGACSQVSGFGVAVGPRSKPQGPWTTTHSGPSERSLVPTSRKIPWENTPVWS